MNKIIKHCQKYVYRQSNRKGMKSLTNIEQLSGYGCGVIYKREI
jgi:hypothetical protein